MDFDELNNLNINNSDDEFKVEEDSLKNIKEIDTVPEENIGADEVFQSSEEYKEEDSGKPSFDNASNTSDSASSSTSAATGTSAAVGAVGGIVGAIAVSAVLVLDIVHLPVLPAVDVKLISASNSSLAFALNTNIEDRSNLVVSLSGVDYQVSTNFQEYVKFSNLRQNEVYTLAVYDNDISRYSSSFYTNEQIEKNNVTITVTSYIDDKLYFYFIDEEPGEKLYTVTVKNSAGTVVYSDETTTPKEYEMEHFVEDVAIFISVNGVLTTGVQVYKPIYDYEHINWVWGEYGETVTAIIPSLNETEDYYIRDIRNFEIDRVDPTCLTDGYVKRQAAFIGPDKNRYEDQKTFTLPALGHDFSDVTYIWSNSYHVCKAEATCPLCGTQIEESVEVEVTNIETDDKVSYTKYTATFENEHFGVKNHYEDLVYGSYPQSELNDASILEELNTEYGTPLTQSDKWTSYNYYASGEITSYMYYVDVDTDDNGDYEYRGVYFTSYRPINTVDQLGNESYQYDNGYLINQTYWFKYEPIHWDILDSKDNQLFVSSSVILDSQSYYHEISQETFIHNGNSGYANNYELSDIRLWLNNEFYNLAFNDSKDNVVALNEVDNSLSSTLDSSNDYVCNNTNDRVFLLSRYEAHEYLSTNQLSTSGTDYAKCQGLYVSNDKGFWSLRTPYPNLAYQVRYIANNGNVSYDANNKSSQGVRPSFYINIE